MQQKTVLLTKQNLSPRLFLFSDGHFASVDITRRFIIGRMTSTNPVDIDLKVGFVSRNHGELSRDLNGYYYVDNNSKNGTYCNGQKLYPYTKRYLADGDVLMITNGVPQSKNDFICMIFSTDYPLNYQEVTVNINSSMAEINIGRGSNKNIALSNAAISANHASFFVAQNGWAIVDHNSTNGVYVNNLRLYQPQYLKVGDTVRISNTHFIFTGQSIVYQRAVVDPSSVGVGSAKMFAAAPLEIHIQERSVWQRAKKLMLLQNINMKIDSGEMVLILGGSGAGKTTFMNAVMGYEKADGKITHGTTDIYEDFESMKYKIGFVPQQDLLRGNDTVYDTLENAADMKMPNNMRREDIAARIEVVLETLGLQRERHSLVSKLSGGQRKRLSIAVEYIANPSLFFLDEPDSGLDGIMAKTLMQNLRTIADEGKIVMVISHAPDRASELFNKVVVLAKSTVDNCGHLAFFGSVEEAYKFFDTDSLEGVVKRINREDEGGDGLSDYYINKYNNLM